MSLAPRGGGIPKVAAALPSVEYMIGVRGYAEADGFVVMATIRKRDMDRGGKNRCPAAEIEVDFHGNGRLVKDLLEPGDKITSIDGFEVNSLDALVVAVNSAGDPHALQISFVDWRTGNEYTGSIDAMKVK